jgi:hypothetical protein
VTAVALTGTFTAALTLGAAGVSRLFTARASISAIRTNLGAPSWLAHVLAVGSAAIEVVAALMILSGLINRNGTAVFRGLIVGASLLVAYVVYVVNVLIQHPGSPCGCDNRGESASVWTLYRTLILLTWTIIGVAWATQATSLWGSVSSVEGALIALPAFAGAVIVWQLPSAMNSAR